MSSIQNIFKIQIMFSLKFQALNNLRSYQNLGSLAAKHFEELFWKRFFQNDLKLVPNLI